MGKQRGDSPVKPLKQWLPCREILPLSGKIFFHKSQNSLILCIYRQKIFSQLFTIKKAAPAPHLGKAAALNPS